MANREKEFHPYLFDKPAGEPYGQAPFELASEGDRVFNIGGGLTVGKYDWGTQTWDFPYRLYTGSEQFLGATGVIIDEVNGYPLRWSGSALDQPTEVSFENSGAFGLDSHSVRWTGKASLTDSNEGGGGGWIMDGELLAQCVRGLAASGGMSYSMNCFWPTSGIPIDHENNGELMYMMQSEVRNSAGDYSDYLQMWTRCTGYNAGSTDAGRVQVTFRAGGVTSSNDYLVETSPGLPGATTNPKWINYTVTIGAGGHINLYIDGVLVPATSTTNNVGTNGMDDYEINSAFNPDSQGWVKWGGGIYNNNSFSDYGNYHGNGSGYTYTSYYHPDGTTYAASRYPCFGSGYLGDIALYDAQLTTNEVKYAHDPAWGYLDENGYIDLRGTASGTSIGADHLTGWWRMRPASVAEAIASGLALHTS
jgi:hypothetical protein